ncbi:MAG TPA: DUF2381 family protein [Archangium sp.]|uniref:DUF2381 family protein n=1 Tax=Archangium sp. TaxID=1872627 RepID=UPI002E3458F0|nr:DUF2381 family protein [Archangium sp.]HEX5754634.1 DUF2381 family protein [Archangium sp.]
MLPPLAVLPLLLAFSTPPPVARPATGEWDPGGERHVELTADAAGQVHTVTIGPQRATTFVFHSPLRSGTVAVEARELFLSVTVDEGAGVVNLLPSGALPPGRELMMTARFADDAVPGWARFRLVVHATRAERQVEVYRLPRPAESYRQAEQRERERAERCEARLARVETEGRSPESLTDLREADLVDGNTGVAVKRILEDITQRPGEVLWVTNAWGYHAGKMERVAVELEMENTGDTPWMAEGVQGTELVGADGERLRILRVWQPAPLLPGSRGPLMVEAEAAPEQTQGAFLLKLGEAGGPRTLTVRGVTFP